jgi:uncharacterized protein
VEVAVKFRVSDDLVLGADLVVSTAGIFATKGMGKSYLAQVIAEELLAHDQVIVVIDPTDVWSGLRSSADGKTDGYPILVIGGDHGDLKLDPEPGAGTRLAEAIVAERFSCVICTDGIDDTRSIRYVREVLETIYRKNREPIHVFVDEADIFAPQQPKEEEDHRCIRAMSHVVRRGRKKGIGSTLITQRPSELNASVRSQVEMLFVLGMLHDLDIGAVERWLRLRKKKRGDNAAIELQEQMIEALDTLQCGDAWLWAPRLKIHRRFRARTKRTFDSGATPKPGQKARKAKKLAPVDIARLGVVIAEAAQRLKDSDPKALRAKITELIKERDQLSRAINTVPLVKVKEKIVVKHVEVVKPADLRRLEDLVKKIDKLILRITGTNADLELHLSGLRVEAGKLKEVATRVAQLRGKKSDPRALLDDVLKLAPDASLALPPTKVAVAPPAAPKKKPAVPKNGGAPSTNGARVGEEEVFLKPAHLRILSAIAWWESVGVPSPDLGGVAFVAKTSTKSSAFDNNRSRLRVSGYIDYPSSGRVSLTDLGRETAPPPTLAPTNEALHAAIFGKITPALGRMLRALIDAHPGDLSLEEFAQLASTSTTSSAFDNNRSWLKARGLAEYPRTGFVRATQLLFPEEAS